MNDDVTHIHKLLQSAPTREWYIAGGCIASSEDFGDIDVFVDTDAAFQAMYAFLPTIFNKVFESTHAVTYFAQLTLPSSNGFSKSNTIPYTRTIQLIKYIYPVHEQLERFDLNVCRKALLPDGTTYSHPTADLPLYVAGVLGYATPKRFIKYANRTNSFNVAKLAEFMEYICTTQPVVTNFYESTESTTDFHYLTPLFISENQSVTACCATYLSQLPKPTRLKAILHLANGFIYSLSSYSANIPEFALLHYLRTGIVTPEVQQHYPEYLL